MAAMISMVGIGARRAFLSLALIGSLASAGCPAGESARCRDLCQTVVACVESLNQDDVVIDETECTITCTSLERDPEGKATVDAYAACVTQANDCPARLACKSAPPAPAKPSPPAGE